MTAHTNPSRTQKLSPCLFYVPFIPTIPQEDWCLHLCEFGGWRGWWWWWCVGGGAFAAKHPGGKDPRSYTNGGRGGAKQTGQTASFRGSCCYCHVTVFVMQETHRRSLFHWPHWRFHQILLLIQINSNLRYGNTDSHNSLELRIFVSEYREGKSHTEIKELFPSCVYCTEHRLKTASGGTATARDQSLQKDICSNRPFRGLLDVDHNFRSDRKGFPLH